MDGYPIVLVASEGKVPASSIIKNIFGNETESNTITRGDFSLIPYEMTTKYYKTTIFFMPVNVCLENLTSELLQSTEALILYIDPEDAAYERFSSYQHFIVKNKIGLGLLVCDKLFDNPNDGVTCEKIKENCSFSFEIIELERKDEFDSINGYLDVLNVLKCYTWSTLNSVSDQSKKRFCNKKFEFTDNPGQKSSSFEKLDIFEKLVLEVQSFKQKSSDWKRGDILSYAEKLAEQFTNIILENDDEHTENEVK